MSASATRSRASGLGQAFRTRLKSWALHLGLDVRRSSISRSVPGRRLAVLSREGIDVVIDVGANAGQYARELRLSGYGGRIVSFEPLSSAYAALEREAARDADWTCHRLALGERAGSATLTVTNNSISSSLLAMTPRHLEGDPITAPVGEETVRVERLDEIADEIVRPEETVALKLDVQGYELHVLRGAERTMPRVRAIEIELSMVELYAGQPLLPEMWQYLGERGFQCVGLEPGFTDPVSWRVLQMDGIFVRQGEG